MQRWQKAGDKTNVPKYVYGQTNTSAGSDRTIFKGDYIRLRNVQVAYKFSGKMLANTLHVQSINVYARGTNLWTKRYDKNLVNDPEQGILGINNQQVMPSRSFTAGVNVTF